MLTNKISSDRNYLLKNTKSLYSFVITLCKNSKNLKIGDKFSKDLVIDHEQMVSRRTFLKYMGATTLALTTNTLATSELINHPIKVLGYFSGNLYTLYLTKAVALLERDLNGAAILETLISEVNERKIKNNGSLTELREDLVRTTVEHSLKFNEANIATLADIYEFHSKTEPKKDAYKEIVSTSTRFRVYLEESDIKLSIFDDDKPIILTDPQLDELTKHTPKRMSLEEAKDSGENTLRQQMALTVCNASTYLYETFYVSAQENISFEALLSLLTIESKGDPYSVSEVGAIGPWQIMRYVAMNILEKNSEKFKFNSEQELLENLVREPLLNARFASYVLNENGYPSTRAIAAYSQGMEKVRGLSIEEIKQLSYVTDFNRIRKALLEKRYLA